MTTINESQTAKGYTPAARVPATFGRKRTIDGIVIHHWGSLGQRHDDVVKFFVSGPGTTSAHFVVSAGRIDCLVSPLDAAWHSGNAVGNATTIGIECHPEATDEDYATVAELVSFLRNEYGALPLSPHRQWNATACPGIWDLPRIDRLAGTAAIAPQSTTTTPKGFLMALTDAQQDELYTKITRYLDAPVGSVPEKVWSQTVLRGGRQISVKQELADAKTEAQALRALVGALSKNPDLTAEQITAAVKAGLADGVTVDVNVNGGK
ncbi:N-acetylmuramoyl-L-alanine amidase [Arthrobacter sp. NPDC056886]|uniref:peptidoglycan recognition protein family protein n=1 Tax=Arthrobacter sp. NPDC056886 TaxID=3345960 RepID=UPI00366D1F99